VNELLDLRSELLKQARSIGVATLAAALSHYRLGRHVIPSDLLPRRSGEGVVAGWARTAWNPTGNNTMTWPVVRICGSDDVLVIATPDDTVAQWGYLASTAAVAKGVAATIVAGAARDVTACRNLGFSVFARAVAVPDPAKQIVGRLGEPLDIAGVRVNVGDLVVADDDGVLVIPVAAIVSTVRAGAERACAENRDLLRLRAGDVDSYVNEKVGHLLRSDPHFRESS
jgi:4-hydroxy-4-methyl-2-oxoglutarate aldolase